LIDPAVYGGHREMDLAMMRLFGGFSERVFAAYAEAFPLSTGHPERVLLCQLYPLLVHLNLFGSGYRGAIERALAAYVLLACGCPRDRTRPPRLLVIFARLGDVAWD